MEEQKIGKVIVDSRAEMTFDRETDYRIYSKTFPFKKYLIEKGQGFIRAIRKGKKIAKEILVSATPCRVPNYFIKVFANCFMKKSADCTTYMQKVPLARNFFD